MFNLKTLLILLSIFLGLCPSSARALTAYDENKGAYFAQIENIRYYISFPYNINCVNSKNEEIVKSSGDKFYDRASILSYAEKAFKSALNEIEEYQEISIKAFDSKEFYSELDQSKTALIYIGFSAFILPEFNCDESKIIVSSSWGVNTIFCEENCMYPTSSSPLFLGTIKDKSLDSLLKTGIEKYAKGFVSNIYGHIHKFKRFKQMQNDAQNSD